MKKVVIKAPVLSASGYGEQSRFALRSLKNIEDLDLYVINIPWGRTGNQELSKEEKDWLESLIQKTKILAQQNNNKLKFDISLQITIPNEFEKMADVNIGYTAGMETTKVSPQWIMKANAMDKIIVPSNHSRSVFKDTVYRSENSQTKQLVELKLETPIETCAFPAKEGHFVIPQLALNTSFNLLSVAQWGPRKNVESTISAFLKEFKDDDDAGLILKINLAKNSTMDKVETEKRLSKHIQNIKKEIGEVKCKIYMLHGSLTEEEMRGLYRHPEITGFVTTTHGEGFGLPMFEAAIASLPIAAPAWSSYLDFLYAPKKDKKTGKTKNKPHFLKIDFDLKQVQKEAVWDGVVQADSQWCYVKEHSTMQQMREMKKNIVSHKSTAKKLSKWILENFSEEKQEKLFSSLVYKKKRLVPENVKGISFCISTNGAKQQKTLVEIASIKEAMVKVDIPYEIILSGDVEAFSGDPKLVLVKTPEDAHSGLLAKLRNNAAEKSKYDTLVFCDDDLIFDEIWAKRLLEFSNLNPWEVLGNRILLPDGGRYWDRATINPHTMIDYDNTAPAGTLYQTGCFWIVRKKVYESQKWNSDIGYYAEKNGGLNEDVEYSIRLQKNGFSLSFDKENLVWHNDDSYCQVGNLCLKKEITSILQFQDHKKEFQDLERKYS